MRIAIHAAILAAIHAAIHADIHGNLPAFEAVLSHLRQQVPDLIIIAGDIVIGAPDSAACWQLAQSLDCPIVRGNHERYLGHFGTEEGDPTWQNEQFAPVQCNSVQHRKRPQSPICR